ncbi:hypothetical protein CLOHYLEM_07738 [[Clostridium] hylemonae DSM 15053]|uniref:Uncharacterized protein n=1 Tax=[Clostridium] hylemonae DSM 15053 TaxID=553973 RepID=C0C6K1_9FIRM|nr:hypothetical protein CLOHYLEM_07738 [[Clostridium] hylemonae DSM 15053]
MHMKKEHRQKGVPFFHPDLKFTNRRIIYNKNRLRLTYSSLRSD